LKGKAAVQSVLEKVLICRGIEIVPKRYCCSVSNFFNHKSLFFQDQEDA